MKARQNRLHKDNRQEKNEGLSRNMEHGCVEHEDIL
jgi:hypothetical protein